ncbi:hypothetical protein CAEBREN_12405 [Caenorhabditis brenneri]|uniref:Uncharacterized protein n=1 Tax=Caenorhabditis brenneri TaxID=135651 RepID=G0NBG3_CAEBE|nr:hypothetical protein CAEBREN_12405 [Caenorhabditis brenneri]
MGIFGGLVNLHPFPGVYCQGLLSRHFSAFTLFMVWCLLFCVYGYSIFIVVLTRLQIVARRGKTFDCSQKYYNIAYFIIALFVFIPVPGMMAMTYGTKERMEEFVRIHFPNNIKVMEHVGVHIFTELEKTETVQFVMVFTVVGGFLYLLVMHILIYRETRVNSIQKRNRHIKEHLKTLYKMIVQTTFVGAFMTISCLLIMKSFFNDPSVDSRISNTIAYSCLCAGSIPSQILMISRNTAYKNFVLRRKPSIASNQQTRRSII